MMTPETARPARTQKRLTRRPTSLFTALLALGAMATGCTTPGPSAPPALATSGAAVAARNLQDAGLRSFLTRNLGRDPGPAAGGAWDFNTLTWVAFYFHPGIDVARSQWEAARAAQSTASARPNPTLTLTPGFSSTSGPDSPWFPAIAADIPFETGGKRTARTDAAKLGTEAARQDLFAAAWKIRSDLRQALAGLSAAELRHSIVMRHLYLQKLVLDLLEQRRQAGSITETEVSAFRLSRLQTTATYADLEGKVLLARQRVAEALGMPAAAIDGVVFAPLPAVFTPAPEALAVARQLSLRSRADVLAALARYDSARAGYTAEAAKRWPDLRFGPSYQWDQGASKWSLGVTLELPVFNRNEGPLAEALARARQAEADFNATQTRVIAEIDRATAALSSAAATLDALGNVQVELEQRLRRVTTRLGAGAADMLEAQLEALESSTGEISLLDARLEATAAAGQLEDALQVPFADLVTLLPLSVEK
jgi:cobalt-zinc-cadmium efflux system outer membrane protein